MKKIEIEFKNKKYYLEKDKLIFVLSKLENHTLDKISEDEIMQLFEKYGLYDEVFLDNLNRIW